jgi:hypothetical protein
MTDGYGYVYCLSNPSFRDNDAGHPLLKIGFTISPDERLRALSAPTGVPAPFKIEFANKIHGYKEKEKQLHSLLSHVRYNNSREFFHVPLAYVKELFEFGGISAGEPWEPVQVDDVIEDDDIKLPLCEVVENGCRIRDTISLDRYILESETEREWVGIYDSTSKKIIYNGVSYSISGFVKTHRAANGTDQEFNGWKHAEVETSGGVWELAEKFRNRVTELRQAHPPS